MYKPHFSGISCRGTDTTCAWTIKNNLISKLLKFLVNSVSLPKI